MLVRFVSISHCRQGIGIETGILLEFCFKRIRISRQDDPNGSFSLTIELWKIFTRQASTIGSAVDLDAKALAVEL